MWSTLTALSSTLKALKISYWAWQFGDLNSDPDAMAGPSLSSERSWIGRTVFCCLVSCVQLLLVTTRSAFKSYYSHCWYSLPAWLLHTYRDQCIFLNGIWNVSQVLKINGGRSSPWSTEKENPQYNRIHIVPGNSYLLKCTIATA